MTFTAAHQLMFSDGNQEPLHDHDWNARAAVSSKTLNGDGLVIDFEELKVQLQTILADLRGRQLESLEIFENQNVSAEVLAKVLFDRLAPKLPAPVKLDYIEVTEAPGCRARYEDDS